MLVASAALLVLTTYCPILDWQHVIFVHLRVVAVTVVTGIVLGTIAEFAGNS